MCRLIRFSIVAAAMSWSAPASADPVVFAPDGCDFQVRFAAAPTVTQSKSTLNRGDAVVTNRADLRSTVDGKTDFLRAECTKIPSIGFVDEAILKDNMNDLAASYKLQNPLITIQRNKLTGAVGKIHATAHVGGQDITLEIYRYTGAANIFDVWVGASPDTFPSAADTAFQKSLKLNGADLQ
jgi:hypothetical protein